MILCQQKAYSTVARTIDKDADGWMDGRSKCYSTIAKMKGCEEASERTTKDFWRAPRTRDKRACPCNIVHGFSRSAISRREKDFYFTPAGLEVETMFQ